MTTRERDLVGQLAQREFPQARARARTITDPFFRAQALAWVARYAPEGEVTACAREALEAAHSAEDPYQRVAAAAWAVRALAERDQPREAEHAISEALAGAPSITNPVSRVDGLFLIWQAAYPLGSAMRTRVLAPLLTAASAAESWRPQRVLQSIIFTLPPEDGALAESVIAAMTPGKYQKATVRRHAAGERQEPRPFFWDHAPWRVTAADGRP